MSSTYDGIASNLAFPSPVPITSSTNTNPITVTTSAPHGLISGDRVDITGHQVNTSANGIWTATRTGTNTFTIPVAGVGVGGSTGQVQPITYGGASQIPSDGDARNAASVNVPLENLFDRSNAVLGATGYLKLAGRVVFLNTGLITAGWASISTPLTADTWTAWTLSALTPQSMELGALSVVSAGGPYGVLGMVPTDLVRVYMRTGYIQTTSTNPRVGLFAAVTAPGVAAPAFGSFSQIASASCPTGNPASSVETLISAEGTLPHPSASILWVQPAIYSHAGGATTASLVNDSILVVEAWRVTGVPQ